METAYGTVMLKKDETKKVKRAYSVVDRKIQLNRMVGEKYERLVDGSKTDVRERVSRYLDDSRTGFFVDLLLAGFSILFAALYVYNTYIPNFTLPVWLWNMEIMCCVYFTIEFLCHQLLLSDHVITECTSLESIVNMASILPVLPISFFVQYHTLWFGNGYWRLLFPIRFLKCYYAIIRLLNRCHQKFNPVTQFALKSYILILCVVLTAAGVIQIAETSQYEKGQLGEWTFFSCFFNSVLVFATIGTPPADNTLARVFVGALAIVLVIIVPYQISKIIDISSSYSRYELVRFQSFKIGSEKNHVVICGLLTPLRIRHFFQEIFHKDHDFVNVRVVILAREEPTSSLRQLLEDPFFSKRATFLKGSILVPEDAERAAIASAKAIFILSRKFGQDNTLESDHRTIMRCMSAKRFAPNVPIYAQLHFASSRNILEINGIENIVCFAEVMHSMLGQNCLCPGFSTLIYHLTSSSSIDDDQGTLLQPWEKQYISGTTQEIYPVTLPNATIIFGMTFTELAVAIYQNCNGVILFAVDGQDLLLNPGDTFTFSGGETAFVIASDRKEANLVSSYGEGTPKKILSPRLIVARQERKKRIASWDLSQFDNKVDKSKSNDVASNAIPNATVLKQNRINDAIVIVCLSSTWAEELEYLISPLRSPNIIQQPPVVILVSSLPSEDEWEPLSNFSNMFLVIGNVFKAKTLRRAGVEYAKRIVVLCGEGTPSPDANDRVLDSTTLAVHQSIVSIVGDENASRVVCELINRTSFEFASYSLGRNPWFTDNTRKALVENESTYFKSFQTTRSFASGLVCSTSLCDSLLINRFFNPKVSTLLREFAVPKEAELDTKVPQSAPVRRSRRSSADSPKGSYLTPSNQIDRASLFSCEVPSELIGKSFSFVFQSLLHSDSILTFGMYRCVPDKNNLPRIEFEPEDRKVPYGFVYVKPHPDEIVLGSDLLYILCKKQPTWSPSC